MHWLQGTVPEGNTDILLSRFGHTAVCVDAREVWGTELVVVYGGVTAAKSPQQSQQAALSEVVVLQPENDKWFTPRNLSEHHGPGARAFHCAAAVGSKMYVFGGYVMFLDPESNNKRRTVFQDLWCLDTATWQWTKLPQDERNCPPRRDMASLLYVGSGKLVLFGGRGETNKVLSDLWMFDLETNTWIFVRTPGPSPSPRKMHTMCLLQQKIFLFGGERDSSPVDDMCWTLGKLGVSEPLRWTQIRVRPSPQSRFGHSMAVANGRLGVFGGCLDLSSFLSLARNFTYSKELWVLDLASFAWLQIEFEAGLPTPGERMCHSMTALSNGRLLLLGGRNKDRIYSDLWWLSLDGELPLPPPPPGGSPLLDPLLPLLPALPPPKPPSAQSPSILQALLNPLKASSVSEGGRPTESQTAAMSITGGPAGTVGGAAWADAAAQQQQQQQAPTLSSSPAAQQSWKRLQGVGTSAMDRLQGVSSTVTSTVSSLLQRGDERVGLPQRLGVLNPLARLGQRAGAPAPPYPLPGQLNTSARGYVADLISRRGAASRSQAQRQAVPDTASARQAAADASAVEQLRVTRLGLPPAGSQSADPGMSTPPNGLATLRADAQEALVMLGHELLRQPQNADLLEYMRSHVDDDQTLTQDLLVDLARRHLAAADAQQLPLRHLDALLCDLRQLCLGACAAAWVQSACTAGVAASTSQLQAPPYVHMCVAELHLRDIPQLLSDYRALLQPQSSPQAAC